MNSSCIEKIKKLLSLAQSDNANERDNALAKAQKLAVENNVDMALLDLSDVGVVKEEELVEDRVELGRQLSAHKRFVTQIVTKAAGVEVVYFTGRHNKAVSFLGTKSSVEFAKWLYSFLLDEYVRRWNYTRKAQNLPATHRNTFYLGVRDGQLQKIREAKIEAEQSTISRHAQNDLLREGIEGGAGPEVPSPAALVANKTTELTQRYTLVVQGQEARRKDFLKTRHPKLGTLRSNRVSVRSHDTYASGTSHGRSIGLNRPLN